MGRPLLVAHLGSGGFYLNLHKGCEAGGRSPVTFRTSRILSVPRGGVILSERCHPLDEAEFRGMHFMPAADIPAAFERLCRDTIIHKQVRGVG